MMFYAVTVQVETEKDEDGFTSSFGLPTFYLSTDVQGITDTDHAERIVLRMLRSLEDPTSGNKYHIRCSPEHH